MCALVDDKPVMCIRRLVIVRFIPDFPPLNRIDGWEKGITLHGLLDFREIKAVGEPAEIMYEMTELVCSILPKDKPRYLMGVGTPANILEAIALGIDMFDCVMPTRNARHGLLFTSEGMINIKNSKWKEDFSPIDVNVPCATSKKHSKAYLRHLFVVEEYLAAQIASLR